MCCHLFQFSYFITFQFSLFVYNHSDPCFALPSTSFLHLGSGRGGDIVLSAGTSGPNGDDAAVGGRIMISTGYGSVYSSGALVLR